MTRSGLPADLYNKILPLIIIEKMKIAIINTLYYPYMLGGAEISVQILAEELVKMGCEISVVTTSQDNRLNIITHNGVKIYQTPLRNIYWPFSKQKKSIIKRAAWNLIDTYNPFAKKDIYDLLKKIAPDVAHTNNLSGFSVSAWDAASLLKIPIVHTSRDYYLIHPNAKLYSNGKQQSTKSISVKAWSLIKKHKSKNIDFHVSISDHVKKVYKLAGFFQNAEQKTIYNSIQKPTDDLIRSSHLEKPIKKFGYIGRIDPVKGLTVLLEAFNSSPSDCHLLIAGTGDPEYIKSLKSLNTTDRVTFIGHTKQTEFFSLIDCLIVPSIWEEPLGRVVLESYSYGIPVIAANSGGINEIVKDGITGFLYEKTSTNELSNKIQTLASKLRIDYFDSCLRYSEFFSSQTIAIEYIKSYKQALQKN